VNETLVLVNTYFARLSLRTKNHKNAFSKRCHFWIILQRGTKTILCFFQNCNSSM